MAAVVIETARLRLVPATMADVDALHRLWTEADVRRFLWDDVVIERERAAGVVAESVETFARRNFGLWAVLLATGGALAGFCGLRELPDTDDVELLYGLTPAQWGRGLATEAARAVLAHAFTRCGLARVIARTDVPNVASARVMQRVHMRPEPPQPDGLLAYAITRDDFAPA